MDNGLVNGGAVGGEDVRRKRGGANGEGMDMSKERWKDHGERGMAWWRRRGGISGKAHAGGEMHFM